MTGLPVSLSLRHESIYISISICSFLSHPSGCTSVTPVHPSLCPPMGSHKNPVHLDGAGEEKVLQREED